MTAKIFTGSLGAELNLSRNTSLNFSTEAGVLTHTHTHTPLDTSHKNKLCFHKSSNELHKKINILITKCVIHRPFSVVLITATKKTAI